MQSVKKYLPAAILVMAAAVTMPAQNAVSGDRPPEKTASQRLRATELLAYPVSDTEGSRIGSISDLIITPSGDVQFLVIAPVAAGGEVPSEVLVPASRFLLTVPFDRGFSYQGDPEEMLRYVAAPGYSRNIESWQKVLDEAARLWALPDTETKGPFMPVSMVLDRKVAMTGNRTARVEDLMVDTEDWRIAYMALGTSEYLGSGDLLFAIPIDRFRFAAAGSSFSLQVQDVSIAALRGFDSLNWPAEPDPTWKERGSR